MRRDGRPVRESSARSSFRPYTNWLSSATPGRHGNDSANRAEKRNGLTDASQRLSGVVPVAVTRLRHANKGECANGHPRQVNLSARNFAARSDTLGVPLPPRLAPARRIDSTLPVLVPIRTVIMDDPLTEAEIRFRALQSYQATVRSLAADGERQVMRYFYRQPGWVRMEFVQPYHGTVMTYDPGTRRVRIWPFGLTLMPALSVAPDSALLRNQRGHRIDRSDVGALLANLRELSARGSISSLGDMQVAGRPATGWDIVGEAGVSVAGVHRYRVWLALDTLFPLRVESFALGDSPIETVEMEAVQTDVRFPERFFTP